MADQGYLSVDDVQENGVHPQFIDPSTTETMVEFTNDDYTKETFFGDGGVGPTVINAQVYFDFPSQSKPFIVTLKIRRKTGSSVNDTAEERYSIPAGVRYWAFSHTSVDYVKIGSKRGIAISHNGDNQIRIYSRVLKQHNPTVYIAERAIPNS